MGRASAAAWWLTSVWPTTMPARNAPSAIDTPKHDGRPRGDRQRQGQDGEGEQLAGAGARHLAEQPRDDEPAPRDDDQPEHGDLDDGEAEGEEDVLPLPRLSAEGARQGRQRHQHQHREDVLDDQPADGDVALRRCAARRCP